MPKMIDPADELKVLEKEERRNPQGKRQYAIQLPFSTSRQLMKVAIDRNEQIGRLFVEIVTDYLEGHVNGVHLSLSPALLRPLDLIATSYGVERETALVMVLAESLQSYADKVEARLKKAENRWNEIEKLAAAAAKN